MAKGDVYYQPVVEELDDLTDRFGRIHYSFEVWRSRKTCQALFPGKKIRRYSGDDIEDPTYMD